MPIINASYISRLPLNQPLGITDGNVPEPLTSSALILVNNSAQAPSLGQNKNELKVIQ